MKNGFQIKQDILVTDLLKQRLDVPYIKKNNKLQKSSWDEAISLLVEKIKSIIQKKLEDILEI